MAKSRTRIARVSAIMVIALLWTRDTGNAADRRVLNCASIRPAVVLYTNSNTDAVTNNPTGRTAFSLNSPACITEVETYHWNNGTGAAPGS